jgi:hypothetical protein
MPDTTRLTSPERAAWRVALRLSLPITAPDIRELLAAAHAAIPPAAGNSILTAEQNHQLLSRALDAAGVRTGRYDDRIAGWLAQWEDATVAAIAGWVQRAAARPSPGDQAADEPMHDALTTERAHQAWLTREDTGPIQLTGPGGYNPGPLPEDYLRGGPA